MKFNVTRRDVLKFAGGAAVGTALSPLPWSLTDDLSIWTQNWRWIPKPPRGERTTRVTRCALCPTGCPIEARCIGGLPVALRAAADDVPLCALGMTGHHLPYHPSRLTGAVRVTRGERRPATVEISAVVRDAARAIDASRSGFGSVVVLDTRPGRSVSWAWRRLLAGIPGAVVVAAPGLEGASLGTLASMLDARSDTFGLDLTNARTIMSFGAPIAEGWGGLARFANRDSVHLVQVEPVRSRTAESASRWLPARPGTEAALALGIAHVLLNESLVDTTAVSNAEDFDVYRSVVARFPADRVAAITGLVPDDVVATARELATRRPTIVVAGEQPGGGRLGRDAETAIFGLNLLLGNIDCVGGIIGRAELPSPVDEGPLAPLASLDAIPEHSVSLLIVDASAGERAFPWPFVGRKLTLQGARVITLTPFFAGHALHADYVVPTAPCLEAIHELPMRFDLPVASVALSAPLLPTRGGTVDPVTFIRSIADAAKLDLAGDWATSDALIGERLARIHDAGAGSVSNPTDGSTTAITDLASADELRAALLAGGRWNGATASETSPRSFRLTGALGETLGTLPSRVTTAARNARILTLVPRATRDTTAASAISPVITKLYQESGLRTSPGTATINPRTAAALGLVAGPNVRLLTAVGATRVTLSLDEGVMPGVVEVPIAPERTSLGEKTQPGARPILDLLAHPGQTTWGTVDAELLEG